jgi:hypothetical protein
LKWSVPWLTSLEIKCWGWKWWFERVHRNSMEVKDFGQTPFDYISTDLDYKLLKRLQIFEMGCPMAYTT